MSSGRQCAERHAAVRAETAVIGRGTLPVRASRDLSAKQRALSREVIGFNRKPAALGDNALRFAAWLAEAPDTLGRWRQGCRSPIISIDEAKTDHLLF